MGVPFKNDSYKHKNWFVPSKFNIALVEDAVTGKEVVLKLYDVKDDYENELGFLKDLNSSNARRFVVDLKGVTVPSEGSSEVRYGIAMEVLGENLHDFLSSKNDLKPQARITLSLNLVEAVQAIHRAKVAHCDLKPHEVCLSGMELKLIDFDSARNTESFEPLDRFTTMYAAPEIVRAEAKGELSSFKPTKAIDLWPLGGLMLAQNFHPDMEPVFRNDEEAQQIFLGDPTVFIEKHVSKIKESYRQSIVMLLRRNAEERCSASQVMEESIFRTGTHTLMVHMRQDQKKIALGPDRLENTVKATQRMIVEYGDTTVPRVVMLVPDDLAKRTSTSNLKDIVYRLASDVGVVKRYNLFFVCEGCTLFPSTACSCGNVLNNPVRVEMPGETLKKLTPALKAAAMLYTMVSAAGNIAGVKLPLELPGVNDVVKFAGAVNEFTAAADKIGISPSRLVPKDHGQKVTAVTPGDKAYGEAYAELETLLKRSGLAPKDNTCQGLLKVVDQTDGAVYWVCKTHAEMHADRLFNASTVNHGRMEGTPHKTAYIEENAEVQTGKNFVVAHETIKEEIEPIEADVATVSATKIAALLEDAAREVAAQEDSLAYLWTEGNFGAANKQASELVEALQNLSVVSDDMAQFDAKRATLAREAAARGYQGIPRKDLNDRRDVNFCQGGCGDKLSSTSFFGKVKHSCKGCGQVVCVKCSPSPKLKVVGYSGPQRLCKTCAESVPDVKELTEAAAQAAKQSATARENSQRAKASETGAGPHLDVVGAVAFLEGALSAAIAEKLIDRAASLELKLEKTREFERRRTELQRELTKAYKSKKFSRRKEIDTKLKTTPVVTLFVAIALDAFPLGTIVRASVAGGGVAAGTAGEVLSHTPIGKLEVHFKEAKAVFEVGSLCTADLPNGWTVYQTCSSVVEVSEEITAGQPGQVLGWSKPFDRDKIMVDFSGYRVNVLLNQIEGEKEHQQRLVCWLPSTQNIRAPAKSRFVGHNIKSA